MHAHYCHKFIWNSFVHKRFDRRVDIKKSATLATGFFVGTTNGLVSRLELLCVCPIFLQPIFLHFLPFSCDIFLNENAVAIRTSLTHCLFSVKTNFFTVHCVFLQSQQKDKVTCNVYLATTPQSLRKSCKLQNQDHWIFFQIFWPTDLFTLSLSKCRATMHGISRLSARKSRRQSAGIKSQRQKLSFFKTLKSVLLCSFYSKDDVVVPSNKGRSAEVNELWLIFL